MTTAEATNEFAVYPGISFKTRMSLRPLVNHLEKRNHSNDIIRGMDEELLNRIRETPALLEEPLTPYTLEKHRDLFEALMSRFIPGILSDDEPIAVMSPFGSEAILAGERFQSLTPENFHNGKEDHFLDPGHIKELSGYLTIASNYYGLNLTIPETMPFVLKSQNGDSIHFRVHVDRTFLECSVNGELPYVSPEALARLKGEGTNVQLWRDTIPADRFVFTGLVILRATDVTEENLFTGIQKQLLTPGSIIQTKTFENITSKVRKLIDIPDAYLGLASFQGETLILLGHGGKEEHHDSDISNHFQCARSRYKDLTESRAFNSIKEKKLLVVDTIEESMIEYEMEREMWDEGIRSILVAPLVEDGEPVGGLVIKSRIPGSLNASVALKLQHLIPYFALAVVRSVEELENRVQLEIRKTYTAIHPSVEWKFRDVALSRLQVRTGNDHSGITFENVYPIYAQTDIKNSTAHRNEAIQEDLQEQLALAGETLRLAYLEKPMMILDHLGYRIESLRSTLDDGIHAGEEEAIIRLLRNEVEPTMNELSGFGNGIQDKIDEYRMRMDPAMNMIYDARHRFDRSVSMLNSEFSRHLEKQQEIAQKHFPHYFEKNTTDGIDFGAYTGASMQSDGHWDPVYIRNLRLWQLVILCTNERIARNLLHKLPVPLEVTHLAVVQNLPLSIHYSSDANQFEVEGAYNIRYEIMKKRIDKAVVKGTNERITQAGYLTVVYSQAQEGMEYREYLHFLMARGCLAGPLEELEVEDLQGIRGLHAFRAPIVVDGECSLLEMNMAEMNRMFEEGE